MIDLNLSLASSGAVKTSSYDNRLRLGYSRNRSVYRLVVTPTGEWEGLTIRALWRTRRGTLLTCLVQDGVAEVPAFITCEPGEGRLTFEGSDGTRTLTSADVRYSVAANSGVQSDEPEPAMPAWQELVGMVEQAKSEAWQAGEDARQSAAEAGQKLEETKTAKDTAVKAIKQAEAAALNAIKEGSQAGTTNTSSGLTPEQFGAVGDGVADDVTALQAAIDKAAETHVPLELKQGATYRHGNTLELKDGLTIFGNGAVLLSDIQCGTSGSDRPAISACGPTNYVHMKDIRLDNIVFRAAETCETNYMLRFMRVDNVVITNCLFDSDLNDMSRSCMDIYGACSNFIVENNVFRQLSADRAGGIWVRSWTDSVETKNIRFLNCDFYKAGGDEVFAVWGWNGHVKDVLISGCNFYEVNEEKYVSRGYNAVWFITLGQSTYRNNGKSGITDVRMENCVIRAQRCETLFRMVGSGTHAVVDNCDIYLDQPDDMPKHDFNQGANPMLARGNTIGGVFAERSAIFTNNRIHLHGDTGRQICFQVGSLRNNIFELDCGRGPASTYEVIGNTFLGKIEYGLFWDCNVVKRNTAILECPRLGWMSGASEMVGNKLDFNVTGDIQGAAIFHNNWGSGNISDNRLDVKVANFCDIKQYDVSAGDTPLFVQNNAVTVSGARCTRLESTVRGLTYRKNNYFNGFPEPLFECTGVAFAEDKRTDQYKKYSQLDVQITPANCTDPVVYTWNDADGILIDMGQGRYRPMKNGTASVTVHCGMYSAAQTIQVALVPVPCESLKLSRTTALCGVGRTTYLKAFASPYWTTDDIVWASSAEDVATVTQDGEVTLLKTGSANITVTCGSQTAMCKLTVVEASQLPTYTEGEWLLDGTVAYVPMPDIADEHTLYVNFDVDTSCMDVNEEASLITSLLNGQTGQEAIRVAFGADGNGFKSIRWDTTDVTTDEDGNVTRYHVGSANTGFKDDEPASTAFLYIRDGVAGQNGTVIWSSNTSKVRPAPASGYLSLNVQTSSDDKPVSNYATGAALQAALDSGAVHATKATGFKLKELILFANSSYTTLDDIKKYREGAEIDLRFNENGEPVNAGTAGDLVIAGKGNSSVVPVSSVALDKTSLSMEAEGSATLTAAVLPAEATDRTVSWSVDPVGTAILSASIGSSVTVTALKAGSCTITATAGGKSAQCAVTIAAADPGDTSDPVPVFSLPETVFTASDATVVDTGIKLFESADGAKDYTIIIAQKPSATVTSNQYCLLHCMEEITPWPGFAIAGGGAYNISVFTKRGTNLMEAAIGCNANNAITFAVRFSGKRAWVKAYAPYSKSYVESKGWVDITDYTAVDKSLLIGGYQESDGTKGRFWDGTVYFCKIYDKLLTEEQVNKIMES